MVECLLSAFADEYPVWFTSTRVRSFTYRTLVIISCFLLGVPMTTNVSTFSTYTILKNSFKSLFSVIYLIMTIKLTKLMMNDNDDSDDGSDDV